MALAAFLDQALGIEDPEALFGCYLNALSDYGVDRVIYSALRNTPHDEAKTPAIFHCYPEDWVNHYMAHDYMTHDPVRFHGLGARHAFTWKDMIARRDLTATQALIMNQGQEAGLYDGVAVPFHGPMGEVYGVGLASSVANPDVGQKLTEIQVLSIQFHTLFFALFQHSNSVKTYNLTNRELEVLKWCAAGKNNRSIGERLGMTEHGVDFYMRTILRKLNADTRVAAVVKAMRSGDIIL